MFLVRCSASAGREGRCRRHALRIVLRIVLRDALWQALTTQKLLAKAFTHQVETEQQTLVLAPAWTSPFEVARFSLSQPETSVRDCVSAFRGECSQIPR